MNYTTKILSLCFIAIFLSGCATNHFETFYKPVFSDSPILIATETPEVLDLPSFTSQEAWDNYFLKWYEEGYIVIGNATWKGPDYDLIPNALQQAKDIEASYVLIWKTYIGINQNAHAVKENTQETSSNTTGYGNLGRYSGPAYTYTPGTTYTQIVPYTEKIYDYESHFLAKIDLNKSNESFILGSPSESYMKQNDTRLGCLVRAVMKDSLAYRANIFRGDVITYINGEACEPQKNLPIKIDQENKYVIDRDGKTIIKKIFIRTILE